jgi:hypothetical protein
MLTPEQRTLRARIAASVRWSREDPARTAQRGQAGLIEKFRREALAADPDVTEPELTRRAESARRAHMARLALASSKARGGRKAAADAP